MNNNTTTSSYDRPYKIQHEEFISDHEGSSLLEPLFILAIIPFAIFFSLKTKDVRLQSVIVVSSILLPTTILADYIAYISFVLTILLLLNINFKALDDYMIPSAHLDHLTNYRAATNLVSAFCILAVDFKIFPRIFAKTETYGFSLMDLGVGFFIVSNALVAKRNSSWTSVLKGSGILIVLGLCRILLTSLSDYHEHVSEYGTHWNFFFTLATCRILIHASESIFGNVPSWLLALGVGCAHELLLRFGNVADWALSDAPRTNLISQNREGIASTLGYVSLYFFARTFNIRSTPSRMVLIVKYLILSTALFAALNFLPQSSRRLANLPYVVWVLAQSSFTLAQFLFVECCLEIKTSVPVLFHAINARGLEFFLIANLLTGVINLTVDTLNMSDVMSVFILAGYMLVLCSISLCRLFNFGGKGYVSL